MMWMITYRAINKSFDQAVQFFSYPASFACRVILFISFCFIASCNNWPEPAERVLSVSERHNEIPEAVDNEYLNSLMAIAEARLGFVINKGAELCIPGQIKVARSSLLRAKHEIDGQLLLDAQYNIAMAMEQLDYIVRIMSSLAEGSECLSKYAKLQVYEDYDENLSLRLSDTLNCQCTQISKTGSFTRLFQKRLDIVSSVMIAHPEITLTIYSANKTTLTLLESYFRNKGLNPDQIVSRAAAESSEAMSADGLGFSIQLGAEERNYRVKSWKKSLKVKSVLGSGGTQ